MKKIILSTLVWLVGLTCIFSQNQFHPQLKPYVETLIQKGKEPVQYVLEKLEKHDLIIFDDALHNAAEPFDFYQQLIRNPNIQQKVRFIFMELFILNHQKDIDKYLSTVPENKSLLMPVFQDGYDACGWAPQTYLDLMETVYNVNQQLPPDKKYKVVAVSNPIYWDSIHTKEDYLEWQRSLKGRDFLMYKVILEDLKYFQKGLKGIFLTNTRHAYKGIKSRDGKYYWNTATCFHRWHPGKTFSIRIHNLQLFIEKSRKLDAKTPKTSAGMERMVYRWDRMADGLWDSAFEVNGNHPVAFTLNNTPFGNEPYVGNLMLNVLQGQTMADAYDGLIMLKPLEMMEGTARSGYILTPTYKKELYRRLHVINSKIQIKELIKMEGVKTLDQLLKKYYTTTKRKPLSMIKNLKSKNSWKNLLQKDRTGHNIR
jgi:hypothetical protein